MGGLYVVDLVHLRMVLGDRCLIIAAASVSTRSEMRVLSISRDRRFVQVLRTGSMPVAPKFSQ